MIVNVDGWIYEAPEGTEFVEFKSGQSTAGHITFYDKDGKKYSRPDGKKIPEPPHWTQRIKNAIYCRDCGTRYLNPYYYWPPSEEAKVRKVVRKNHPIYKS